MTIKRLLISILVLIGSAGIVFAVTLMMHRQYKHTKRAQHLRSMFSTYNVRYITVNKANVRTGPGTNFRVRRAVIRHDKVWAIKDSIGFTKVFLTYHDTTNTAWIYSKLLGLARVPSKEEVRKQKLEQKKRQAAVQRETQLQSQRRNFIQKMIVMKIFFKVEKPAQFPRVYVGGRFYSLPFDDKAQFINVVWAYYKTKDSKSDIVVIKDGYSGKDIGKYAEVYGGLVID